MTIPIGTRLGPYEITGQIGAGGMGVVYKASDTRLRRTVALKFLTRDRDDGARDALEREARAISALNHPNVCTLYDVGQFNGADFLVFEFVEGQTLAERLARGPLSTAAALRMAADICAALDAAHSAGIVHRDLKPGNIMLTGTGAKLLDFGVAGRAHVAANAGTTELMTLTAHDAGAPAVAGTLPYMAPEQLQGLRADTRADLFSLGAVLYEALTGRRAFDGPTGAHVITAVLDEQPKSLRALQPGAPALLEHMVSRCLDKSPDARWQNARDLGAELRWILGTLSATDAMPARPRGVRGPIIAAAALLLTLAGGMAAGALWIREPASQVTQDIRFETAAPEGSTFPNIPQFALSPRNGDMVYVVQHDNSTSLWLRALGQPLPRRLDAASGGTFPFWSPDGAHIGFFAAGELRLLTVATGNVRTVCGAVAGQGGTWSDLDTIAFASAGQGLSLVAAAAGSTPKVITRFDAEQSEIAHRNPMFLPGGQHVLYSVLSQRREHTGVFVVSTAATPPERVLSHEAFARYVAPGFLVYSQEIGGSHVQHRSPWRAALVTRAAVLSQPFDSDARRLHGSARVLIDEVRYSPTAAVAAFDVSSTGAIAHQSPDTRPRSQLQWFDRAGTAQQVLVKDTFFPHPRLSPDGRRLLYSALDAQAGTPDLWLLDFQRGSTRRLTADPSVDFDGVWAPDGNTIAFASDRTGPGELYLLDIDSSSTAPRRLTTSPSVQYPTNWAPDGNILFQLLTATTGADIWSVAASGNMAPFPIAEGPLSQTSGVVSPQGRWMAMMAGSTGGHTEVFIQPYGKGDRRWQVSTNGGRDPQWRGDGRELFYITADFKELHGVSVEDAGTGLRIGRPVKIMDLRVWPGPPSPLAHYAAANDGQRFLIDALLEPPRRAPIAILVGRK